MITYIRHIAAAAAGSVAAFTVTHYGIDPDTASTVAESITEGISLLATAVMLVVYAVAEKLIKRYTGS